MYKKVTGIYFLLSKHSLASLIIWYVSYNHLKVTNLFSLYRINEVILAYSRFLKSESLINPFSAGTRTERVEYLYWLFMYTHNMGIQMKQKELTKIFMMIGKKPFFSIVYTKLMSVL